MIDTSKTNALIRFILGPARGSIASLVCAIDLAVDLMFVQNIPMDDILVTRDIYPTVARRLAETRQPPPTVCAVSRHIERLANQCWDAMVARDLVLQYIGEPLADIRGPRDIIFYLAFYVHLNLPFYTAIRQQPALLF